MLPAPCSIVSHSYVNLVRARKALQRTLDAENFSELYARDKDLGECLNAAFDDMSRNNETLVVEVERILTLYSSILSELPDDIADSLLFSFPNR